jgi:hypothetical protein
MRGLIFILAMACSQAWATGTATSGGGGAFVWRDAENNVVKSELIDLWEAENIAFNWPNGVGTIVIPLLSKGSAKTDDLINDAITRLAQYDSVLAAQVRSDYAYISQHVNDLPPTIEIELPDDLKVAYFPEGGPPEGMMRYNGITGLLDVDVSIFSKLVTVTDIAASYMHEAVYKTMRESIYAHKDSIASRHLNSCLFSSSTTCLPQPMMQIPTDRWAYECVTGDLDFIVYPNSNQAPYFPAGYRIEFKKFGEPIPFDTYQEIPEVVFAEDGTMVAQSSGTLHGPLDIYDYGPGFANIQLQLDTKGNFVGLNSVQATSAVRGGVLLNTPLSANECVKL